MKHIYRRWKEAPVHVAAVSNDSYDRRKVDTSFRQLLTCPEPPLPAQVKRGDRVLVKVNMGCTGVRAAEHRFTSHPTYVKAVIAALVDCGARVSFGDDVARMGKYCESLYERTGMREVARSTGAKLIDFVGVGAQDVRGGLLVPRKYLVTNAYFDADFVVNVANCRSHQGIGLSGAMKNMFGCVIGLRKQLIHNLFPGKPRAFSRVIADIYRTIKPDLSFLDLTSVVEGAGFRPAIHPVGLMLASTDGVALDTVAAHTIGYEKLPLWITHYGNRFGAGCNRIQQISIRGIEGRVLPQYCLTYPRMQPTSTVNVYDRATAILNNTLLRPRPFISPIHCTGCGDCVQRCPVNCIERSNADHQYRIDLTRCADCGCCLKECEAGAINMEFVGVSKMIRAVMSQMPASRGTPVDPAAMR